jgi:hypothetical protein
VASDSRKASTRAVAPAARVATSKVQRRERRVIGSGSQRQSAAADQASGRDGGDPCNPQGPRPSALRRQRDRTLDRELPFGAAGDADLQGPGQLVGIKPVLEHHRVGAVVLHHTRLRDAPAAGALHRTQGFRQGGIGLGQAAEADPEVEGHIALYGYGMHETWTDMRRFHYTDVEAGQTTPVYADLVVPTGINLFANNNGKLVQRARPRYNSEYLYNVSELTRIGAIALDYHTLEQWFSKP